MQYKKKLSVILLADTLMLTELANERFIFKCMSHIFILSRTTMEISQGFYCFFFLKICVI